jgi:hypothetical protein
MVTPIQLGKSRFLTPEITLQDEDDEIFNSPAATDSKQLPNTNITNITSSSLIGPFKSDLELCLFLVQRTDLINLTLSMTKASGFESAIAQERKPDKFSVLPAKVS